MEKDKRIILRMFGERRGGGTLELTLLEFSYIFNRIEFCIHLLLYIFIEDEKNVIKAGNFKFFSQ